MDANSEWSGQFPENSDILESLQNLAREKQIEQGWFSITGAVRNSKIGFYDQEQKKYLAMELDEPAELLNCTGWISKNENGLRIRAHATLSDKQGRAYGGRLMAAKVFKAEYYIRKFQ